MKVLLVGGGAREHAMAWALSKSPEVTSLICAPGNPGMTSLGERHSVQLDDIDSVVELAEYEQADLVVVGPEGPLVAGLADRLRQAEIKVFGPTAAAARIEGSKSHAKRLMASVNIPTADWADFDDPDDALAYAKSLGPNVVVKADGLASGKGVTVCSDLAEAEEAIRGSIRGRRYGDSGSRVVVEEKLTGPEVSILAFCDGKNVVAMEGAQDFKRVFDDDQGPNTGGMGSYSPVPICTPKLIDEITDEILEPMASAVAADGDPYVGVIYAGLMLTGEGPKVIEFNCRFGDPEAQALIPRMESDLADIILRCVESDLSGVKLLWKADACVCVAAASQGYPGEYRTGFPISGLEESEAAAGIPVFHANTKLGPDGRVLTSGGRVLSISSLGSTIEEARQRAYGAINKISFQGMFFRSDIGASPTQ